MSRRVIWKGAISFGLVHIPVALHAATSEQGLDFDWLDKRSMDPVGYKRVNKRTGREVARENIVKGIAYEEGQYVVLSQEEIAAAYPKTTQTIEIDAFVAAADIPFVYLQRPYYIAPINKAAKVYALLREILHKSGKVGIAKVVVSTQHSDNIDNAELREGVIALVVRPVLADADIGIAVGSATDLARETAALVLPRDGLWMLPWVVDVARAVRMTILTNLMWAFGYNCIAVTLAMLGWLQPVLAAAVMAGSSIIVVLNSLRLERLPNPVPSAAPDQSAAVESAPTMHTSSLPIIAGQAIP